MTTTNEFTRLRVPRALAEVLGTPWRIIGFLVVAGVVAFFYTLLLPFSYTQRFELANWNYLDAYLLVWSIVLGLAMGLVLSIQVYAIRRIADTRAANSTTTGLAFVAGLLPSFLCCTPIIPSLLAFIGMSGVGLYTTTGTLQHFFAVHQTEFLATSLILLSLMCWWGLRKVTRSQCFTEDGCAVEATPSEVSDIVSDACCSDANPAEVREILVDAPRPTNNRSLTRGSGHREGILR